MLESLERIFKLKERNTSVKTEVIAGITTFMTMAYILAVNPNILSASGMDSAGVFVATALAAAIGSILMGLLANLPFALAPGMGLNAFFAFTVVIAMGYSWQFALTAVLVEGIIFVILSLTGVREAIFNSIPMVLKNAVSVGIGLFIAFIGFQNAKIAVADSSTGVTGFKFSTNPFQSLGITVVLAIIGIIITAILLAKKVPGAILIGIISTFVLGGICQLVGGYIPNPELGMYSLKPDFSTHVSLASLQATALKFDFSSVSTHIWDFIIVTFSFLFVDIFDTLGTLTGVATKANMLDEEGKLPNAKGAMLSDAIATIIGACLGTSTTTTYVESAAGVEQGGRTGLTAIVTGILFILAMPLAPIFLAIPSFATAPALIIVGAMMITSVVKIDWNEWTDAIPAFLCIIAMPFMYSISEGICYGIISYVAINLITGKAKEKKMHWILPVLAVIFIIKYMLI